MDCERVQDRLSEFLEGSLPEIERAGVTAHLAECLPCKATKEGLEETLLLLRRLPPVQAPPDLLEGIRRGIAREDAPPTPLWKKLFLPAHIKIPLEAAAAVVLFLLVYGAQNEEFPKPPPPLPAARMDAAPAVERETAGESSATEEKKVRSRPGKAARSDRDSARTASSVPAAPQAPASLPVVPAQRVSTAGERVEPPPAAPPLPRIARPAPLGGEVTIEVAAEHRAGLEERIAVAAIRLGGSAQGAPVASGAAAETTTDAVRVHLPVDSAKPFLAELSRLGTLPEEGMSGWAELPPGAVTEVAAYIVRIRVR